MRIDEISLVIALLGACALFYVVAFSDRNFFPWQKRIRYDAETLGGALNQRYRKQLIIVICSWLIVMWSLLVLLKVIPQSEINKMLLVVPLTATIVFWWGCLRLNFPTCPSCGKLLKKDIADFLSPWASRPWLRNDHCARCGVSFNQKIRLH